MKVVNVALAAAFAVTLLSGCCLYKAKCYPYPVYDYSPARTCAAPCAVACPAPAAPCVKPCK